MLAGLALLPLVAQAPEAQAKCECLLSAPQPQGGFPIVSFLFQSLLHH